MWIQNKHLLQKESLKLFNDAPYQYNKGIQRIDIVISKKKRKKGIDKGV